jgi:hypothetical protein
MQFTAFNKAIAATVGAILVILGVVFKQDLGAYADLVVGVVTALIPVAVYVIPNVVAKIEDGGAFESYINDEAAVADTIGEVAGKFATPKAAAPVVPAATVAPAKAA